MDKDKMTTIGVQLRKMPEKETLEVRMQPDYEGHTRFTLAHRSRQFHKIGAGKITFNLCEGKTMEEVVAFLSGALRNVQSLHNQRAVNQAIDGMLEAGLAAVPDSERRPQSASAL